MFSEDIRGFVRQLKPEFLYIVLQLYIFLGLQWLVEMGPALWNRNHGTLSSGYSFFHRSLRTISKLPLHSLFCTESCPLLSAAHRSPHRGSIRPG